MNTSSYLALLGVAVVLAVTPGPDTVLTLGHALRQRRAGMLAAAGAALGVFGWAGLVAAGVAAFLDSSPAAFQALRIIGGAYLFHLGYRAVTAHVPAPATAVPAAAGAPPTADSTVLAAPAPLEPPQPQSQGRSAFAAGLVCCLTNPKTGLFFLALLPQFTPPGAGALFVVVVMGGTVAATIGVYLLLVALAAHTAGNWLNRPAVTRKIELVAGVVFVALGLMTTVPVLASWI